MVNVFIIFIIALASGFNSTGEFGIVMFDQYGYSRGYLSRWDNYLVAVDSGDDPVLFRIENGALMVGNEIVALNTDSNLYGVETFSRDKQDWQIIQDPNTLANLLVHRSRKSTILCKYDQQSILGETVCAFSNIEIRMEAVDATNTFNEESSGPHISANGTIPNITHDSYISIRYVDIDITYYDFSIAGDKIYQARNSTIFFWDRDGNLVASNNSYLIMESRPGGPVLSPEPIGRWILEENNMWKYENSVENLSIEWFRFCPVGHPDEGDICPQVQMYAMPVKKERLDELGDEPSPTYSITTSDLNSSTSTVPSESKTSKSSQTSSETSSNNLGLARRGKDTSLLAILL
ncbi:uncharacterized protein RJT20DRAFT_125894, partial [Scheffersomyces xylosifermentans]|uniref:uncharacterized protein n=1 Tax=Scheffersomyces xylosifermentans TaxID=1304137 RepID=UPI00315C6870